MQLSEYLVDKKIEPAAFAKALRVSKEAVRLWALGERTPRPELMRKIAEATGGQVMPNDFMSVEAPTRDKHSGANPA